MSTPLIETTPASHVVEAIEQPRKRRLAGSAGTDDCDLAARGHVEGHVVQDLPLRVVAEFHMVESHRQGSGRQVDRVGAVFDLAVLFEQPEHPIHVGERLLDLPVHHPEEVERDIELNEQAVDEHEIAERERGGHHTLRGKHHEQRDRDRDDEALPDVENAERRLRFHCCAFVFPQVVVVALRLVLFVVEVLDRLVIEQTVDRPGVRARIQLVRLPADVRTPFGDPDRERDVDRRPRRKSPP